MKVKLCGGTNDGKVIDVPAGKMVTVPIMMGYDAADRPKHGQEIYERPHRVLVEDGVEQWTLVYQSQK